MASFLVVLSGSVATAPKGLKDPKSDGRGTGGFLEAKLFRSSSEKIVTATFTSGEGLMLHTSEKIVDGNSAILRSIYLAISSELVCLFRGYLGNFAMLKGLYGLDTNMNEAIAIAEIYRTARDNLAFSLTDSLQRHLEGQYAFVLYDLSTKTAFIATDEDGTIPFFWGVDPEGKMVISDGEDIVRRARGGSFSVFPKGCFYTSTKGLQHIDEPLRKLKAVHRYDDKGEVGGTDYELDEILTGILNAKCDF